MVIPELSWIWVWIAIIVISVVFEAFTIGLTSIWMSGGALAALVFNALGASVLVQIVVFFVVTFLLIYFTRPIAVKYINKKRVKTNYESIIGADVRITEKVDNHMETGKAVYNGMEWTARAVNSGDVFDIEETVKVEAVEGVKLLVIKK